MELSSQKFFLDPGPKNNDNNSAFSKVKEIEVSKSFVAPGGTHGDPTTAI